MSLRLSGGRRLKSPQGSLARPTPARVRLAVMNILSAELQGCRWLDLCAGSGAMACEALQRDAGVVLAVEQDRRLADLARANLKTVQEGLNRPGRVEVHGAEVLRWLQKGRGRLQATDLIYADPPYRAGLHAPIAAAVLAGGWLRPEGTLILECESANVPESPDGWWLRDRRRYGTTTILLLQQQQDSAARHSAVQQGTAAVLVPGRHEQPQQGDGDETQHDAAEQRFDHGRA